MNLAQLFAALYASEIWHSFYRQKITSPYRIERQAAVYARAKAMVVHDRVLAAEAVRVA